MQFYENRRFRCTAADWGAFWYLQNLIWLHRSPLGCTLAFQDLNFGAQALIGLYFGISRIQLGCTGVNWGALWHFETSIQLQGARSGCILASQELNWAAQCSIVGHFGTSNLKFIKTHAHANVFSKPMKLNAANISKYMKTKDFQ